MNDTLIIEGVEYVTRLSEKYKNRPIYKKPNEKNVITHIPGQIINICVKENAKVKKGDNLFILEAMKMQNHIVSPCDGTVKKIHVKKNQAVCRKALIIELE